MDGNGLRGDIGKFDMPKVKSFSIAGNKFRGELPLNLRNNSFEVFDISNNQVKGYLDVDIVSAFGNKSRSTTYRADVNRLSGRLTLDSIATFTDVSVLDGNLSSCETIPSSDDEYDHYNCVRYNLERSLDLWS